MNVSCSECRSVFRVDPAKIPPQGVRARCSVCGAVFAVPAPAAAGAAAPAAPAPTPPPVQPRAPTPAAAGAAVGGGWRPPSTGAAAGIGARVADPAPAPPPPRSPTPVRPAPAVHAAAPVQPAAPAPRPPAPPPPSVAPPRAAPPSAAGAGAPAPGGAGRPTPGRSAINPFLNSDPGQKARRLARALVSDLVAYHPQLREQGLRDGTLKQLFKEEIKKSYEEYVDQVGRDFAESTTHFQEALNEILAGGRQIF